MYSIYASSKIKSNIKDIYRINVKVKSSHNIITLLSFTIHPHVLKMLASSIYVYIFQIKLSRTFIFSFLSHIKLHAWLYIHIYIHSLFTIFYKSAIKRYPKKRSKAKRKEEESLQVSERLARTMIKCFLL